MATTSSIVYCTERDLSDIYPMIKGYDLKTRVYNWQLATTNLYYAANVGLATQLFANGSNLGSGEAELVDVNSSTEWHYKSSDDSIYYFDTANNPNDMIMEVGDDWATIKTRFIKQASRLIESHLDAKLSRELWYDREMNFPEIIVRVTALQAVVLLISAHDPNNDFLESFKDEKDEILKGLSEGTIVLPNVRTADSSNGVIRTVRKHINTDLIPVEIYGDYNGSGYELLKIYIESGEGGAIGTARMTVYGKSTEKLKDSTQVLVNSDIIDGDFQALGVSNMYIRWSGDDVTTAVCTATDEYEIELYGDSLGTSTPSIFGSIGVTRR